MNYDTVIERDQLSNGRDVYTAYHPEIGTSCRGQGYTLDEAVADLEDARTDYITALVEDGQPIPGTREDVIYWRISL